MGIEKNFASMDEALAAAESRIAEVAAEGRPTPLDGISAEELATWSGVDEIALVGTLAP